jgi:23S rRNA (cytosine1962-C5)-methyltransferase
MQSFPESRLTYIVSSLVHPGQQMTRLLHGSGGLHPGLEFLSIDSIGNLLFLVIHGGDFKFEKQWKELIAEKALLSGWTSVLFRERGIENIPQQEWFGERMEEHIALEGDLRFKLILSRGQNIGIFPDMRVGRQWVRANSKGKRVLNCFAYTCGFSIAALAGGAEEVVNIDMKKNPLNIGRENHRLNNIELRKVKFLPHNIFKSFGQLRKSGPYDLIIFDPPPDQGNSFQVAKDYPKLIKRAEQMLNPGGKLLACLNLRSMDHDEFKSMVLNSASSFVHEQSLDPGVEFAHADRGTGLKMEVFRL